MAVDLKLAGGSLPSPAGLDWLVEKGYRTLLDLRESSEVSPSFIADVDRDADCVTSRYRSAPGSIDREHVERFGFEVAAGEARPLYFFDSDGTRSGALWYVRRIATDRIDQQVARREAEELGLSDQKYWSAVTKYVSTLPKERTTSTSDDTHANAGSPAVALASPTEAPRPNTAMATPSEPEMNAARALPIPAPVEQASPFLHPVLEPIEPTQGSRPAVDTALPGNPFAWRSFTVMIVTCVGLPLAYWSRNLAPANRADYSGQSAGTRATIVIASRRVGCMNVICRACKAIRNRPSKAFSRTFEPYLISPRMGVPRDASCTRS